MPLCVNGHGVPVTAAYCSICGAAMNGPAPQPGPPTYLPPPPVGAAPWSPARTGDPRTGNSMGVTSLVLGILSLAVCWPLGILAVIFGAVGLGRCARGEATNRGQAQWGIGLGIAGTSIGLLLAYWVLSTFGPQGPTF